MGERAVEDALLAGVREGLLDPPQEGMRPLLGGGCLERPDAAAGGVAEADHVLDRAALAAGVHALEDEQDPAPVARPARREQAFLQVGQVLAHAGGGRLARGLVPGAERDGVGVVGGQIDPLAARHAQQLTETGLLLLTGLPPGVLLGHGAPLPLGYLRHGPVTAKVVPGV
ncbi:hypothetical protein GCM10022232_65290 [Streptomyces plumbiresistens]|uniref:Uncharacterized protein n=1 Tax=Streptomyces plumbiresistens TaxID=511811 RepID=A0ABP7SN77_9ACTN